jgi:hypothetical protein
MHTYYVLLCSDEWVGMLICDDQLFHNLRILPPSCLVCFLWILVLFSTLKKNEEGSRILFRHRESRILVKLTILSQLGVKVDPICG